MTEGIKPVHQILVSDFHVTNQSKLLCHNKIILHFLKADKYAPLGALCTACFMAKLTLNILVNKFKGK